MKRILKLLKFITIICLVSLAVGCATPQPKPTIEQCDLLEYKNNKKELISLMNVKYSYITEYFVWMSYRNNLVSSLDGSESSYDIVNNTNEKVISEAKKLRKTINELKSGISNKKCKDYYSFKSSTAKELKSINSFLSLEKSAHDLRKRTHTFKKKKIELANNKKKEIERKEQAIKVRQSSYSSLLKAQYIENNMSIKLLDFYQNTATLLLTNLSQTKILSANYQHCKIHTNELGGEECLWITKTINSSDEYGNKHQIYWLRPTPIKLLPNESAKIRVPLGKTIPNANIKLKFAKQSLGNKKAFTLTFK